MFCGPGCPRAGARLQGREVNLGVVKSAQFCARVRTPRAGGQSGRERPSGSARRPRSPRGRDFRLGPASLRSLQGLTAVRAERRRHVPASGALPGAGRGEEGEAGAQPGHLGPAEPPWPVPTSDTRGRTGLALRPPGSQTRLTLQPLCAPRRGGAGRPRAFPPPETLRPRPRCSSAAAEKTTEASRSPSPANRPRRSPPCAAPWGPTLTLLAHLGRSQGRPA